MAGNLKCKNVVSEENIKDVKKFSLEKLNLDRKKKLVMLCLDGLLVHRKDKNNVRRGLKPDVIHGRFRVFKRPFCTDFIKFCFERFEVGIFSSANIQYVYAVLSSITDDGMTNRFEFVWGHKECIHTGIRFVGAEKPIFLKNLKQLWQNGKYSSSNTLLIDIEPDTCLLNPPNTAIFPPPYKKIDSTDTFLGPNGELRAFLDGLADTDHDVPTYVKEHRIGQPAITPSHPDWSSYRMILEHILTSVVRANWIDNLVEEMVSENQDSPTSGAGTSSSVPNLPSANVVADILSRLDGIFDKLTKLGESLARLESKLLQIEAHIYCHFPSPSSSLHSVP